MQSKNIALLETVTNVRMQISCLFYDEMEKWETYMRIILKCVSSSIRKILSSHSGIAEISVYLGCELRHSIIGSR